MSWPTYQTLCWNYIFRLQDTIDNATAVISNGNRIYEDSCFLERENMYMMFVQFSSSQFPLATYLLTACL